MFVTGKHIMGYEMTKEDAFNKLWIKYDYCMMGYDRDILYKSMSKKEVLQRLKEEEIQKMCRCDK